MEICTSCEHPRLAWDGFENEPCPLCQALHLSDAKDRVIVTLKAELTEVLEPFD